MCKILGFTNMKNIAMTSSLLKTISKHMIPSEKDGFGYSVMDKNGKVWGEKFSDVKMIEMRIAGGTRELPDEINPIIQTYYTSWGDYKKSNNLFGIFHSRNGTSETSVENTHPFISDDNNIHLIHNGVVDERVKKVEKLCKSSCDSEILLRTYETKGLDGIQNNVTGWYAFMTLLAATKELLIVKDDHANLYVTWLPRFESYMFCTTPEIIEKICKDREWRYTRIEPVKDLIAITFQPKVSKKQEYKHETIKKAEEKTESYSYSSYWKRKTKKEKVLPFAKKEEKNSFLDPYNYEEDLPLSSFDEEKKKKA
jgi:predicted glutamine amidotransferase